MEWTRIEAKWHDMAQRLQQASPASHQQTGTEPDAVTRPESKAALQPVPCEADDMAARATV